MLGMRPWRCGTCEQRFRAWLVPARYALYAHCPHCGNLDLQHVMRDRVVAGWSSGLARMLRVPAYRCDECRHRFFSMRRYRRIRPNGEPQLTVAFDVPSPRPARHTPSRAH
jgi:DNA-directed RNA polymerase subunit RPC12/RpoP